MAALVHMRQRSCDQSNARGTALAQRIAAIDPDARDAHDRLAALTLGLVDALLVADTDALESALNASRERIAALGPQGGDASTATARGWLLALLSTTQWGLERLPSPNELVLQRDTLAVRFLDAVSDGPACSSRELETTLRTGGTQVSRVGRGLLDHGLVVRRYVGQHAYWEITPRGRRTLENVDALDRTGADRRRRPASARARQRGAAAAGRVAAAALLVERSARVPSATKAERVVRPHANGGWCLTMPSSTRAILRFSRRADAERRGKEILARVGGGLLHVVDADGNRTTKSVEPSRRRKS